MRKKLEKSSKAGARSKKRDDARTRSLAARDIAEAARELKAKAEQSDFKMIVYLLNLVELEAMDRLKSIEQNRGSGGSKRA